MSKRTRIAEPGANAQDRRKLDRVGDRREARSRGRQAAAAARRRQQRIRAIVLSVTAVVILALGAYFLYGAITYEEPGQAVEELASADHVPDGTIVDEYNSDPPTSGPHYGNVASWGVHDEPVQNELQVHNLEHGGIVIQYNDTVSEDVIAELEEITNQCDVKLLLAPRPDMEAPIAVTAWGRILTLNAFDEAAIQDFIDAYVDEGPERIASESERWEDCN